MKQFQQHCVKANGKMLPIIKLSGNEEANKMREGLKPSESP
jgi:hypothetical protein